MKKFFLAFAFLGLFTFLTPKVVDAVEEDCYTTTLYCTNTGVTHIIVVCDDWDDIIWGSILCGYEDEV